MPTSELVPFTKAGGMAVVPKDLATNLAAVMNGHQKGEPRPRGRAAQRIPHRSRLISDSGGEPPVCQYSRRRGQRCHLLFRWACAMV